MASGRDSLALCICALHQEAGRQVAIESRAADVLGVAISILLLLGGIAAVLHRHSPVGRLVWRVMLAGAILGGVPFSPESETSELLSPPLF